MMRHSSIGIGVAGLIAIGAWATQGQAATELKFSIWAPPKHKVVEAGRAFAEAVSKASNGELVIKIFTAGQLGAPRDHFDMGKRGVADIVHVGPGYTPGRFPIIAAAELPFLFNGAVAATGAIDEWYRKYAPKEMEELYTCLAFVHEPGSFHTKRPVIVPEDVKGQRIRSPSQTISRFVSGLGGSPVTVSIIEAREVLRRGVADGIVVTWGSMYTFRLKDVVTEHLDVPLYTSVFTWSINKRTLASLSSAQRQAVLDNCTTKAAMKAATPWAELDRSFEKRFKAEHEAQHHINKLDAAQLARWRAAAEPLHRSWAGSVRQAGGNPEQIWQELEGTIKKYNASY